MPMSHLMEESINTEIKKTYRMEYNNNNEKNMKIWTISHLNISI